MMSATSVDSIGKQFALLGPATVLAAGGSTFDCKSLTVVLNSDETIMDKDGKENHLTHVHVPGVRWVYLM